MGTFLHSCVEVREPIELSSVVVSGVDTSIGVLDGGQRAASGREDFFLGGGLCSFS